MGQCCWLSGSVCRTQISGVWVQGHPPPKPHLPGCGLTKGQDPSPQRLPWDWSHQRGQRWTLRALWMVMQTPTHPSEARGAAGEREGEEQGSFSGSPGGEPTCFQLARQHFPDVPLCPLPMAGAEGEGQQDLGDNSWKFCEARGGGGRGSEGLDRAAFWGFRGDHQTALSAGYWLGYWSWGQPPPLSAPGNEK